MNQPDTVLQIGQGWSDEPAVAAATEVPIPELRVTAVHHSPYISIYPHANGSYSYGGYIYEVWQLVARQLDLRYRMVPMLSGVFGSLDGNGTWTGMVGELAYGRADIALAILDFRQDRAAVIDYIDTAPVGLQRSEFFIRRGSGEVPTLSLAGLESLLKPLDTNIMWTLLASVFVLSGAPSYTLAQSSARRGTPHGGGDDLGVLSALLLHVRDRTGLGDHAQLDGGSNHYHDLLVLGNHDLHQLYGQPDLPPNGGHRGPAHQQPEGVHGAVRLDVHHRARSWTPQRLETRRRCV